MTSEYRHTPVLLAECLEQLTLQTQHTFVDATLGGAGHSFEVAKRLGHEGTLIGIDQDEVALAAARKKLESLPEQTRPALELLHGNFGELDGLLTSAEVPGIDAILFDLGVSSVQIDTPSRGFSFKEEAPLDMRMDPSTQTQTRSRDRQHLQRSRSHSDNPRLFGREVGIENRRLHRARAREGAVRDPAASWWRSSRPPSPPRPGAQAGIPRSEPSRLFGLKSTRSWMCCVEVWTPPSAG